MAATALRALALIILAFAAPTPRDIVTEMASSLAGGSAAGFLEPIAKSMPARDKLVRDVQRLNEEYEVSSSVETLRTSESGETTRLELDWFLELKPLVGAGNIIQRREKIQVTLERSGKSWKVTSLKPLSFFSPP